MPARRPPRSRRSSPGPAAQQQGSSTRDGIRLPIVSLALLVVTLLAYSPVLTTTTGLLWDDDGHLTKPALQSLGGLWRIWFDLGATQQYYPVVHSAFWLQAKLWGASLTGYHAVSVVLHACSAFLLVTTLRRLAVPGAILSGVLFALHPVHVESVAWITELKNTLSCVFFLAAALAYLRFDETRATRAYVLAVALFVLALLSKSVTATLPAGLLVVLWWRRGRLEWRRDVMPLVPFVLAGIAAGSLTVWVERTFIGAEGEEYALTFVERTLVAGRAIWFYLASLAWPAHLSFNYPRWQVSQAIWWQYLFPIGVVALIVALWRLRARGALAALLFFCVTVAPALGFVNVYPFRYSFVADHFQYHASVGIIALAAAGIVTLLDRVYAARRVPLIAMAAVAIALGLVTRTQASHYVDAPSLYRATIAANPDSWLAHNNLATMLVTGAPAGVPEGIAHAREALRVKPDYVEARYNLAVGLEKTGDFAHAVEEYREVLRRLGDDPAMPRRLASIRRRLGVSLIGLGRIDEAVPELERSVRLDPESADAQAELGVALARTGRRAEALPHFREAVRLAPQVATHHANFGSALFQQGRTEEALSHLTEAVRLDPSSADTHHNLGAAYLSLGRFQDAVTAFREALRLRPNDAQSQAALTVALSKLK